MRPIYRGKTKDVYEDGPYLVFYFKDSVLGEDGREDTGGNEIVGERRGKGSIVLDETEFFFRLLEEKGIRTHFVERIDERRARFLRAERIPLEVIYRELAYGSFLRRYQGWVKELKPLGIVEFTLKDDSLKDPLITEEAVVKLGIASEGEVREMKEKTRKVAEILREFFSSKGLQLVDFKLEFGRRNGELIVIDELSGDTMRVIKDGKLLSQEELREVIK
ncbi:phosphoribosylaminoimidazolesuccinocarboxamide synthase [Thermococcus kodakarensis KOD1]|uniref:Phosphoribosylaminoimidazole-succinocarboxamide synthase n=1 Tax=Thermococcus kodakarensis (strain ATCC BAA-918 / JCM 12380 / KOD1) TaxID=69014 RepID=Q5JD27_THEKO|nr:phosphoribosylaminoimidazolesuccinocarboxamide synthase [Thermococcus kodakarensis]WCN28503.1 phosphoribosylaminoimidazolesuccinocarboxamide synthase [Thermococcus kodakarensis]WCN30799.1 phosphoribosylaminoimidazolesuccinocarboxamide synthase [Thermococcus kodakarensis]BAD84621.1 phosphoribosylaminoimidazolesuccinocarboxamide synthase [Thermococcus kodakarensis KOD1]